MKKCDVIIVGHAINQSSGGFSDGRYTFLDTSDAKYLYNNCFLDTYCAEPMAFMQLAAQLEERGLKVEVLDGLILGLNKEQLVKRIDEYDFSVINISIYESTKTDIYEIARYLKKARKNVTIVTGGPYATISAEKILTECDAIDYIVVGDADNALPDLVKCLLNHENVKSVSNLFYRDSGRINRTIAKCVDINGLARPKRLYSDIIVKRGYSFAVSASRGCGYASCGFCYLKEYQRVGNQPRFRYKKAEIVYDEICELIHNYEIDRVSFTDEDFFGDKEGVERAVKLFDMLIDSGIRISLHVNARAKTVLYLSRTGLLDKCKKAGVDYMYVGLESYNDRVLKSYDKGITTEEIDEVVAALEKYNIKINPGLITFDPSLTIDEVKNNIDLYRRIKYYDLFIFTRRLVFYPESSKKVMALQSDEYFTHSKTKELFRTMEEYRDKVFPWCLKLSRKSSTEELCDKIIQNHYGFFYSCYDNLMNDMNCDDIVEKYAKNTIELIGNAIKV